MVRILVVDDSQTARASLRAALEGDPDIQIVAEAETGEQALGALGRHKVDLVTMDVHLGRENGFDIAARIMEAFPCPILVVTGINTDDPQLAFRTVEAGALEIRPKLPSPRHRAYENERRRMIRVVKALSKVPVVTRRARRRSARRKAVARLEAGVEWKSPIVVIGASTGGPPILQALVGALPERAIVPIVIVQHIFKGFAQGLASWLATTSRRPVIVCQKEMPLEPGSIYLAPGDRHLRFLSSRVLGPSDDPPRRYHRPSIDVLFESAALHLGSEAVGIVLTGMGSDGAEGLSRIQEEGGTTIVQDLRRASSTACRGPRSR